MEEEGRDGGGRGRGKERGGGEGVERATFEVEVQRVLQ